MVAVIGRRAVLRWFLALSFGLGAASAPLLAQDAQLYDDPPPEDAAYVRFFGFPEDAEIDLFGITFSEERLTSGSYNILNGDKVEGIDRGQILTVVPDANGAPIALPEPARTDRKVLLRLVNLDPGGSAALYTEDGTVEIIAATASGGIGTREVNPIQIAVLVHRDGTADQTLIPLTLRLDEHLTIIALPNGETRMVEDNVIPDPLG